MATDLYKTVLWNDGEDIVFGDLNDQQRFLTAKLFDQVFEKMIPAMDADDVDFPDQAGSNASTAWAYCLEIGGGGRLIQGSAANKVKVTAGTIMQKIASADGNEAKLLAYTLPGTDEFTISNGHATLNRVDMIQMKLEMIETTSTSRDFKDAVTGANSTQNMNKTRQVQCTLSVKSGANAANPAYPSPDAGYVPLGCVIVPATWTAAAGAPAFFYDDGVLNTGNDYAELHDLRMPLNVQSETLWPGDAAFDATYWTRTTDPSAPKITCAALAGTSPANALYFYSRRRKGRLLAVQVYQDHGANTANKMRLCRIVPSNNYYTYWVDISGVINTSNSTNYAGAPLMTALRADVEKQNLTTGGSAGSQTPFTVTGNGTHTPPIWAGLWRGPTTDILFKDTGNVNQPLAPAGVAIEQKNDVNGPIVVYGVRFYWAVGL